MTSIMTITPLYYFLYMLVILMCILASAFVIKRPLNKSVILSVIFIFIFSLGLYQLVGNPEGYRQYLYVTKINQLISELQTHLQIDPNSSRGWYLLGKLYLSQGRVAEANAAFAKAETLSH